MVGPAEQPLGNWHQRIKKDLAFKVLNPSIRMVYIAANPK